MQEKAPAPTGAFFVRVDADQTKCYTYKETSTGTRMSEEKKQVRLWCRRGEHYWFRDAQRGQKPHNCSAHRPEIQRRQQRLWCENGEHWWERVPAKGKPVNCAAHRREQVRPEPVAPAVETEEQRRKREEAAAKRAETLARRKAEQDAAEREAAESELIELRMRLPELEERYNTALEKASNCRNSADVDRLFNRADLAMNALSGASRRVRELEALVEPVSV